MKRLSIKEKISLAYRYSKFKEPNLILGDLKNYKLLKIDVIPFETRYIVDYYAKGTLEERKAYIEDNISVFKICLSRTPNAAIVLAFPKIENLSFSEIQLILEIAGK